MRFNFFFTRKRKRDSDDAALDAKHRSDTLEAFPGIPEDATVTHILSPDILSDPIAVDWWIMKCFTFYIL